MFLTVWTWQVNHCVKVQIGCVVVQILKVLIGVLVGICSPMLIPRQLSFSLYSGAVITEGLA